MPRFKNRNEPFDASSLGDEDGCLDFINDHQYFNNDVSENFAGGSHTVHRTFNVPEDGILTGTVYLKNRPIQTFEMDVTRKVTPHDPPLDPNSPKLLAHGQGFDTGILVMFWTEPVEPHEVRLVMSYEYNITDELNQLHFGHAKSRRQDAQDHERPHG